MIYTCIKYHLPGYVHIILFTMGKLLHVYTVFNFLLRFLLLLFPFFKASGMSMA